MAHRFGPTIPLAVPPGRVHVNRLVLRAIIMAGDDIHPDDLPLYPYSTSDSGVLVWAQAHAKEFFQME